MLVRYFKRPSRIEQLCSNTGGHLLEGFAKELSQGRYQWVAARKHIRQRSTFSIGSPIETCRSRALKVNRTIQGGGDPTCLISAFRGDLNWGRSHSI